MAELNQIPSLEIAYTSIFVFIFCNWQIFSAEQR
jgi:hypothetical protein